MRTWRSRDNRFRWLTGCGRRATFAEKMQSFDYGSSYIEFLKREEECCPECLNVERCCPEITQGDKLIISRKNLQVCDILGDLNDFW